MDILDQTNCIFILKLIKVTAKKKLQGFTCFLNFREGNQVLFFKFQLSENSR